MRSLSFARHYVQTSLARQRPMLGHFIGGQQARYGREGSSSSRHHLGTALVLGAVTGGALCESGIDWDARQGEHAWLEEVEGDQALKWAKEQNLRTVAALGEPTESATYSEVLAVLESSAKIPAVRLIGESYYNFWTDAANPRGVWRRCSRESYAKEQPDWEVVLDVDALGKKENESWVYKGASILTEFEDGAPKCAPDRALVTLSPGGSDAVVRREFDLNTKSFVKGGFELPTSKSRASWLDRDTLIVGVELDEGDMTSSGYPRVVREWKRGTAVKEAKVVYEGETADVSVGGYVSRSQGSAFEWRYRSPSFYTTKMQVRRHSESKRDGVWYRLDELGLPDDAQISHFGESLMIEPRSDWVAPAGSLIAVDFADFIKRGAKADFKILFSPTATTSLEGYSQTQNVLILSVLDNVKSRLTFLEKQGSKWADLGSETDASIRGLSVSALDDDTSDECFAYTSTFTEPTKLAIFDAKGGASALRSAQVLKSLPDMFNSDGLETFQAFATSTDGTKIPYFCVRKQDATSKSPCLLYGYGGFEISLSPYYASTIGKAWLEKGGTYVVANIRGGGEFGPKWHQAALRENRQLAYDDFAAVARSLATTGVAEPSRIAVRGGSNGGLLVGNAYVQYPELFGACVCAVPLLDMKRYSHLLAGASWMAEYGDPDTEDWTFLKNYSPYHNIDLTKKFPPMLMTTSTKDDRVHPYHARSFVRRLQENGVQEVYYYENMEGGHGGAADAKQSAYVTALYTDFLFNVLNRD